LDFDALQLRLHPAPSRVRLLARETPSSIVFFDLLCEGDRDLRAEPFQLRRQLLENILSSATPPIHLTDPRARATRVRTRQRPQRKMRDSADAARWNCPYSVLVHHQRIRRAGDWSFNLPVV